MAENDQKILTAESDIAFNCVYDLYFLDYNPEEAAAACKIISRFHPVTPEELSTLKPHLLKAGMSGSQVKEFLKLTCLVLGARYRGPRQASASQGAAAAASSPRPQQKPQPQQKSMPLPPVQPSSNKNSESSKVAHSLFGHARVFQIAGILGLMLFIMSIMMALLICLFSMAIGGEIYFFNDETTAIFWTIDFILLGLGGTLTPLYLFGLHFLGLGQIIRNTAD